VYELRKLIKELRKSKERNLIGNLRYIDLYAEYVKKAPNKEWSHRQSVFLHSIYKSANKEIKTM